MTVQSVTPSPRQSNFEILRIIAMFFVMMVHANFMSIGGPTLQDYNDNFVSSVFRLLFENISLLGVNVFIMISGWFSIKANIKNFSGLMFQVWYFGVVILLALTIMGIEQFTPGRLYQVLLFHKAGWFVISYVILYLLSPILNKFSEYASKQEFKTFLITYFALLIIFGWIDWSAEIGNGFSALSFVGMYMLARYAHKYVTMNYGGRLFIVSVLLNTVYGVLKARYDLPYMIKDYDNPFIILGAVGLIFYFSHLNVNTSRVINYVARSTFAVYLFHIYPDVLDWFCGICNDLFVANSGIVCLLKMTAFMLCVYVGSIVIDAPRRLIWRGIWKVVGK
jgi:surface polysaccharide O-acyltransferase-like enzyme